MQSVLAATLVVSVGLAWWLSHAHAAALRVGLGPLRTFDNHVLPLELSPPAGWKLEKDSDNLGAELTMTEEHPPYGPPRNLTVRVERLPPVQQSVTPEDIALVDMPGRPQIHSEDFSFLGQPGVLKEYDAMGLSNGMALPPRLYSCVVLPSAKPLFVRVTMDYNARFAPADIDLLKQVARSLQPVDPSHPAPPISVPVLRLPNSLDARDQLRSRPDNNDESD